MGVVRALAALDRRLLGDRVDDVGRAVGRWWVAPAFVGVVLVVLAVAQLVSSRLSWLSPLIVLPLLFPLFQSGYLYAMRCAETGRYPRWDVRRRHASTNRQNGCPDGSA